MIKRFTNNFPSRYLPPLRFDVSIFLGTRILNLFQYLEPFWQIEVLCCNCLNRNVCHDDKNNPHESIVNGVWDNFSLRSIWLTRAVLTKIAERERQCGSWIEYNLNLEFVPWSDSISYLSFPFNIKSGTFSNCLHMLCSTIWLHRTWNSSGYRNVQVQVKTNLACTQGNIVTFISFSLVAASISL